MGRNSLLTKNNANLEIRPTSHHLCLYCK